MTNIGGITVMPNGDAEALVFVADGMGSGYDGIGNVKRDTWQKLFPLENYLLLGTGRSDWINTVAMKLSEEKTGSAKDLSVKVLDITNAFGMNAEDGLNFLVGGPDNGKLNMYHVNCTGRQKDGSGDYKNREYQQVYSYFDGVGQRHVSSYIQGSAKAGRKMQPDSLTDAMLLAYEYGKEGATDQNVNDKLQFGIIRPEGISMIYHPEIVVGDMSGYIKHMLGLEPREMKKGMKIPERIEIGTEWVEMKSILDNFYQNIYEALASLSETRWQAHRMADQWMHDRTEDGFKITQRDMSRMRTDFLNCKKTLSDGLDAFVNRGVAGIVAYNRMRMEKKLAVGAKYLPSD